MRKYKEKYEAHIHSEKWKSIRKAKAEEQHYTCECCNKVVMVGFHVHHKTYAHLGNEPLYDFMFLCEDCHVQIHKELKAKINIKKKKRREQQRTCANCFFSQKMIYKGHGKNGVLYCNLFCRECESVCSRHRKGEVKSIVKPKKKRK